MDTLRDATQHCGYEDEKKGGAIEAVAMLSGTHTKATSPMFGSGGLLFSEHSFRTVFEVYLICFLVLTRSGMYSKRE